jgi:hypothetical protein
VYEDDAPPYLVTLSGTHYQMGYDLGLLFGPQHAAAYNTLLKAILGNNTLEPIEQDLFGAFMDWQWADYLSGQTPQAYKDELQGATDGGKAAGVTEIPVGTVLSRGLVLANLPGSLGDMKYVLEDELAHWNASSAHSKRFQQLLKASRYPTLEAYLARLAETWNPLQCSMIGIWGNRTFDGRVLTGRNLDWESNTGINQFKLITVFKPVNETAHVTLGFGGLLGALTGMSARGLTVHEANLEEKPETFRYVSLLPTRLPAA